LNGSGENSGQPHADSSDTASSTSASFTINCDPLTVASSSTMRKIDKALERPAYNFVVHSAPVQEAPRE
jgi:hypothetical protein